MCGLDLVSYLAPVTAVQRLQVASRSAVRQEQRSCSHPCWPGLVSSSGWLWTLINSPSSPQCRNFLSSHARGCPWAVYSVLQGNFYSPLGYSPWLSAKGLCLPPLPWRHPLMLCVGNCCRNRVGVSRNFTQMPQKVFLLLNLQVRGFKFRFFLPTPNI